MDTLELSRLRESHPALRLLRANLFAPTVAFLWRHFTAKHQRIIDEESLVAQLDDDRFAMPEDFFVGPSIKYLKDWVEAGYLRHYYTEQDDIPRYELTPAIEKLMDWLYSLRGRSFVGTESRLKTIFELMRDLREQTEADVERRVKILQDQRAHIEQQIARVLGGEVEILSDTQIKERFAQLEDMARQLLRDFSEVEQNFRDLDRSIRTRITRTEGSRGDVIAAVFTESDHIAESEQGRSFSAFFEFLMSGDRRDELDALLQYIYDLPSVKGSEPDRFLLKIQTGLLDASGKVMATRHRLSAQLRRFLDDRLRHENTRILRLIHSLEARLLQGQGKENGSELTLALDDLAVAVQSPVRKLFRIPLSLRRKKGIEKSNAATVATDALFAIEQIDERRLVAHIRRCLETQSPVTLENVVQRFPLRHGVAELVTYLKIASKDSHARFQDDETFHLILERNGKSRSIEVPQILFHR